MSIFNYLTKYRREFLYAILIFVAWELALIPKELGDRNLFMVAILISLLIQIVWIVGSFIRYSERTTQRFSEVILKTKIKKRFSVYVSIPLLLSVATGVFLLVSTSVLLNQMIIILIFGINAVLFIHIRGSYKRDAEITRRSRNVFNFIDIILFYLILSSVVYVGVPASVEVFIVIPVSLLLLLHQLIIHRQDNLDGILVLLLSVITLGVVALMSSSLSPLIYPLFMTNIFYLIISWWNIRLDGLRKLDDYFMPLIFTLMSSIVLFNF